ncbi:hypothetical protein SAMN06297280_3448 [Arsukibacterium tuosuense]|uniref:Tyr recombinase domain-containing protein n=1 Tax=Arsukibacterium tuosuense TaxID=1323745 RepID=A0A285JHL4_9GAMM|nr:site-specific integrase [Arsukibacterium tuosuense]SNY58621.1 hypothetical protein SAMN06297280_3448 [Arsukibacterium tuosuense]
MNIFELHEEIQLRLQRLNNQFFSDTEVVVLTQQQYNDLFWQLLHTQQSQRFKDTGVNLVEQLNYYIAAHRSAYPASFSIRAPVKLKRPSPPAKQGSLSDIHIIEKLDDFFHSNLTESQDQYRFYLGRLLYSAMRYGGLLRKDYLNSLKTLLLSGQPQCYKKLLWFELQGAAGETHIWQPDNMTVQLINHWYSEQEHEQKSSELDTLKCLHTYLQGAKLKLKTKLRFSWLVQAINSRLSLEISPFSLAILTGAQPNLTLKPQVFYRLISQQSPPLDLIKTSVTPDESNKMLNVAPLDYASHTRQYDHRQTQACLKEIKALLRQLKRDPAKSNQSRQQLHSNVAGEIQTKLKASTYLPPCLHYLLHWASVRLTSQSRWSGKLSPSTLASYLDTIANPLMLAFAERNPINIAPDELSELYTQVIDEGTSLISQTKRARILRDFHIYLEMTYQVSPCHLFQQYIAKSQRLEALTVDANILMPWEYRHACDFLLNSTEQQSGLSYLQTRAVILLLILGFRCGLRRREVYFLRLQDIEIPTNAKSDRLSDYATLYITPHEQRSLKTTSAERRIPFGLLLNDAEKVIFFEYLKTRQKFGTEHSPYLFYFGDQPPLGSSGRPLVPEGLLFEPLTMLLKRITGDDSFRFHHLRHSFATWMLWNWQEKPYDEYPPPIDTLKSAPEFVHLKKAKSVLLHLTERQPTRKVLHTISAMIGHAGPGMTLFHYIHSASWLIWMELNNSTPIISRDAEAVLAGVDVRTATRARIETTNPVPAYQGMAGYAARKLLKQCAPIQLEHWQKTTSRRPGSLDLFVNHQVLELDIYRALIRSINYGIPKEICAEEANIELSRLKLACGNAAYFFSQQFNETSQFEHKKRPRNHKRFIYKDKTRMNIPAIAKLPAPPASAKSLNIALRMAKEFNQLTEQEQADILWAAHYAVTSCSVIWPHFRFYDVTSLHRFINAMHVFKKAFAVTQRMRFTLVSRAPLNSEQREFQWQSWLLDSWQTPFRDNRTDKEYAPEGYLAIDFVANKGSDISRQRKRLARGKSQFQYRRRPSEYGVRFGLYLLFMVSI